MLTQHGSFLYLALLNALTVNYVASTVSPSKVESMKKVAMNKEELKRIHQLHYGWYIQAVSALLGAIGKEQYMKMDRNNRRAFVACLDNIDKEHDLQSGAKCLVKAFDKQLVKSYPHALHRRQYDFVDKNLKRPAVTRKKKLIRKAVKDFAKSRAARLLKLNFVKKPPKILRKTSLIRPRNTSQRDTVKKSRLKTVLLKKRKLNRTIRRTKRNVLSLYRNNEMIDEAKRIDRMDSPYRPINMKSIPSLVTPNKTPVKVLTKMLGSIWRVANNRTVTQQTSIHNSFKNLQQLQAKVSETRNAGQFKHRMLDMVVGKDNPLRRRKSFTDRFRDLMPERSVDESVYGLVDTVSKHTNDVNPQFLSPRILPLLPSKYSAPKSLLSPDLFPFYKDDTGNSVLPIPEVLEKSGLDGNDRGAVLELIMDVAGVNDIVEKSLNLMKDMQRVGLDKDLVSITNAIDRAFIELERTLKADQRRDLAGRQYSYLTKEQLVQLYGENGIMNTTTASLPFDVDEFDSMSKSERDEALKNTIRLMADDPKALYRHRRQKRTIKIQYFRHTTLAPYAFAPTINVLNILGPVTLSPSLFSPNVLSPLLLSPPVISPQVGNPLIFSPYVLGPNTISAAVMNAYVFSPYVLSPNVINPYVLSPLILSPYVLCPDVVSPTILSGVVLSPSVLSPSIFTESALSINVLSPSVLS
ncbi:hypothetical protein V3C99_006673 [Haemonchus contortus]